MIDWIANVVGRMSKLASSQIVEHACLSADSVKIFTLHNCCCAEALTGHEILIAAFACWAGCCAPPYYKGIHSVCRIAPVNTAVCLQGVDDYQVDKLADDVACLVKALGHESCTLVAHDWGGVISWLVAHTHGSLIDKLVIMSAPHPKCMYDWDQYKRYALDSPCHCHQPEWLALSSRIACLCCLTVH